MCYFQPSNSYIAQACGLDSSEYINFIKVDHFHIIGKSNRYDARPKIFKKWIATGILT